MKSIKVMVVRIYITEVTKLLKPIIHYLQDELKIRGFSVFRAISGYGDSGKTHESSFVDLTFNLPLVIEFFDLPQKISQALEHINTIIKPEHVIFWEAEANAKE